MNRRGAIREWLRLDYDEPRTSGRLALQGAILGLVGGLAGRLTYDALQREFSWPGIIGTMVGCMIVGIGWVVLMGLRQNDRLGNTR